MSSRRRRMLPPLRTSRSPGRSLASSVLTGVFLGGVLSLGPACGETTSPGPPSPEPASGPFTFEKTQGPLTGANMTGLWTNGSTVVAVADYGVILQSTDAGDTWTKRDSGWNWLLEAVWGSSSAVPVSWDIRSFAARGTTPP